MWSILHLAKTSDSVVVGERRSEVGAVDSDTADRIRRPARRRVMASA